MTLIKSKNVSAAKDRIKESLKSAENLEKKKISMHKNEAKQNQIRSEIPPARFNNSLQQERMNPARIPAVRETKPRRA